MRILQHEAQLALPLQFHEQLKHIAFIEAAYRSDVLRTSVDPAVILEEYGIKYQD